MTNGKSAGFTLIELVIVIVILGVLAAVAAPRFIDLSQDAERSALRAQASSIESASAINFAAAAARRGADDADLSEVQDTTAGCTNDVATSLLDGELDGYTVDGDTDGTFGDRLACTLEREGSDLDPVEFVVIAVDLDDL